MNKKPPNFFCTFTIVIFLLNASFINNAKADLMKDVVEPVHDVLSDIILTLSDLTCETQQIGDLLRSEFSHTCIPASLFTEAIAKLLSPGLYANAMHRLKINDNDLFDKPCSRNNRIPYDSLQSRGSDDPPLTLSFAFCNNVKLQIARTLAIPQASVAIAASIFTGDSPWGDIKDVLSPMKSLYHNVYEHKQDGDTGVEWDITVPPLDVNGSAGMPASSAAQAIPFFPWKVITDNDKMCVTTLGLTGWLEVGCKYIKEPFPQSIYASFMDLSNNPATAAYAKAKEPSLTKCNSYGGCYQKAFTNSRTGIVITAPLIECIKEMAARLLVSRDLCDFDDINLIINNKAARQSSVLFQFQQNIHKTVSALLTIYIILFGAKILLTGDMPPKKDLVNFVIKFLFVVYFSVGINVKAFSGSEYDRLDGMIEWAFPFLLNGISALSSWVMNASPSELCIFSGSEYPAGLEHMSLWDSLDCKVSHYLALDIVKTMAVENMARDHDFANFDAFNFPIPPYYYLLVPAIITGNMTLVSLALMYPLLVISVAAYLVNATVVCMISIVILGLLAPLFVPMYLFNYTKGFFESWVKLMLSFMLQPMVTVVFMVTLFSIYDHGFYGSCKYTSKTLTKEQNALIPNGVMDSMLSDGPDLRVTKIFYLDHEWKNYNSPEEIKGCKRSLGYILNNPKAFINDYTKEVVKDIIPSADNSTTDYMSKFSFLSSISFSQGLFLLRPKMLFALVKDLLLAFITACLSLYLLYNFSAQISEFAADMAGGVSLGGTTIGAQAIFKAGMAALGSAGKMKAAGKVAGKAAGAAGHVGGGGRGGGATGATDKFSAGGRGTATGVVSQSSSTVSQKASGAVEKGVQDSEGNKSKSSGSSSPSGPSMERLKSGDVEEHLTKFFQQKGIDANSEKMGLYGAKEFSRYLALASDPEKIDKVREPYKASLDKALRNMGEHGPEFINRIEAMYSGEQKKAIAAINDEVLKGVEKELGIQRKAPSEDDKFTPKKQSDIDKPSTDKPSTDKPSTDKPSTDKPSTDKPVAPKIDEPKKVDTDKPSTDKSEEPKIDVPKKPSISDVD